MAKAELHIDAFLLGVQKCGSTSLERWLARHEGIYSPLVAKDYHYFSDEQLWRDGGEQMLKWYGTDASHTVSLHAAVNYGWSRRAMERISQRFPEARYVIVLRNPADRAISAYRYFQELGIEERSFTEALDDESLSLIDRSQRHYARYLGQGNYAQLLRQVYEYIDAEQLLLIAQPDLKTRLAYVIEQLALHLDISAEAFGPYDTHINQSRRARAPWINKMFQSKEGRIGWWKKNVPLQRLLPQSSRKYLGDRVRSWNQSSRNDDFIVSDLVQSKLLDYSQKMIDELETYTQCNFHSLRHSTYLAEL